MIFEDIEKTKFMVARSLKGSFSSKIKIQKEILYFGKTSSTKGKNIQ
jgi:hypothetical protein